MPVVMFSKVPIGAKFKVEDEVFPTGYGGATGTIIAGGIYQKITKEVGISQTGLSVTLTEPHIKVLWLKSWLDRWVMIFLF